MKKKALITGINGQDGSYLTELLLEKNYEVHGIIRRTSIENSEKMVNLSHLKDKVTLHIGNIDDHLALYKIISEVKPDECYHLAALSFVSYSFDDEKSIISTNFNSTHYLLSSIKELVPKCKFYLAGSSEMFGDATVSPQNELTRFNPRSMYGISKVASHHVVYNYRKNYDIYACTGITYNHESPRRDYKFVTRKITSAIAKIKYGLQENLELGNIDAKRDWGYAPDYVKAMWLMLNNELEPNDYVISTGRMHSVREFLEIAFTYVGLNYKDYVKTNEKYYRPSEEVLLTGDNSEIIKNLNWKPKKDFRKMVEEMVERDLQLLEKRK